MGDVFSPSTSLHWCRRRRRRRRRRCHVNVVVVVEFCFVIYLYVKLLFFIFWILRDNASRVSRKTIRAYLSDATSQKARVKIYCIDTSSSKI
jgi:hypothetical protein